MEKCIFCGSTRKSAPNLRFFGIPREPGLKRIQWLYVLGDREFGPKDKVCAIHFRLHKPNSDPSHEDFVPHLFLDNGTPELLEYLESLDDCKKTKPSGRRPPVAPSILKKRKFVKQENEQQTPSTSSARRLVRIPDAIANTVALKHGQAVVIKRYKIVTRPRTPAPTLS